MNIARDLNDTGRLALWGGLECTVNRVKDNFFSQMERNGHHGRDSDLERFAALGISAIRYPVLWERTAPNGLKQADWSWSDGRLAKLQALGVTPIVGLVHHGSGPAHTSLIDPGFATGLAAFAGAVAQRYPWVEYYTPVNEPLTTARFSALYGFWYPHHQDELSFVQAVVNQCRATVLAMAEIRKVNPNAKLVQTDDLGKTYGTAEMAELTEHYNERRWLAWDILCGKVGPRHALWDYLCASGIDQQELLWLQANPCPPDIIGINYYVTGERWLDHRVARYPQRYVSTYAKWHHADIECSRALATPTPGIAPLLQEAWERYGLPMAVTEAHIDATREDQLRWLVEIWRAANEVRQLGVDLRAVTVWALLGSFDWNCLVTACHGYYEPGPLDVRSAPPRETALGGLMRELAAGRHGSHPVLAGNGWWRRPGRFFCPPVATRRAASAILPGAPGSGGEAAPPILIVGARGTLGQAFARLCEQRCLAFHLLSREQLDLSKMESVQRAIVQFKPWAIVNAGGYVRVDDAETDSEHCMRDNTTGPVTLARACAEHGIAMLTYSSDLVFDGKQSRPYVESDPVAPLNCYGRSKAEAETDVLRNNPHALVVRTSAFFGPWDRHNFLTHALAALAAGEPFVAAHDMVISPTYVPDLVNASLDLLIDREAGIWHLTNGTALSWHELALKAAAMANIDTGTLEARGHADMDFAAPRPAYSPMTSERGMMLPSLDSAIERFLIHREHETKPVPKRSEQMLWRAVS